MRYAGFLNGYGEARSPNVAAEDTINWYPEVFDAGSPKARTVLYRTPGIVARWILGGGPIRALFEQDGRAFAVSGGRFFELFPTYTFAFRGTVAVDQNPATICSNNTAGFQLFITSGGKGYVFDLETNVLAEITDDSFPDHALMGLFFDGYFIALNALTGAFSLSKLEDGTNWNGTDLGLESQVSDITRAIIRTHDNLLVAGSKHTAPWYNSGNASFPFQPVGGTLIEHGVDAPFSMVQIDNTVIYLGRDGLGKNVVWKLNGFTPQRISTHAVSHYLAQLTVTSDAMAWAYMEEDHLFYVLYLPSAKHTLVYDVTTNLWHKRAIWNPRTLDFEPHDARCHCFGFSRHLVGDRQSGVVSEQSLNYLADLVPSPVALVA